MDEPNEQFICWVEIKRHDAPVTRQTIYVPFDDLVDSEDVVIITVGDLLALRFFFNNYDDSPVLLSAALVSPSCNIKPVKKEMDNKIFYCVNNVKNTQTFEMRYINALQNEYESHKCYLKLMFEMQIEKKIEKPMNYYDIDIAFETRYNLHVDKLLTVQQKLTDEGIEIPDKKTKEHFQSVLTFLMTKQTFLE